MQSILPLFICLYLLTGCASGIKPLTNKDLSGNKQYLSPRPLITNVIDKELIVISPAKEIVVNSEVKYTNAFGEPKVIPIHIIIEQTPTTNIIRVPVPKNTGIIGKIDSGSFFLLYYGVVIIVGLVIWFIWKNKKKKNKIFNS